MPRFSSSPLASSLSTQKILQKPDADPVTPLRCLPSANGATLNPHPGVRAPKRPVSAQLSHLPTPSSLLPPTPKSHETSFSNFLFLKYTQLFAVSGPLHALFPLPRTLLSPNLRMAVSSAFVQCPRKCHRIKEATTPAKWLKLTLHHTSPLFYFLISPCHSLKLS